MSGNNISENVKEALSYFKFDKVPLQKVLNTLYKKEATRLHPDKNNDSKESKEAFQKLISYYSILNDHIMKNNESNDVQCEEDDEIFELFNRDIKNSQSHTIDVATDLAQFWKPVLVEEYGIKETRN